MAYQADIYGDFVDKFKRISWKPILEIIFKKNN